MNSSALPRVLLNSGLSFGLFRSSTDPVLPVQKPHLKAKQRKDKDLYTRDRNPNQKRGRQATLSTSLKERFSLDGILTSTPIDLTEIAIDVGILKNKATEQCSCGQTAWKLSRGITTVTTAIGDVENAA